ncbi:plasmid pRiA4b ORF-3 family protein [Microbacterium sp. NPDC077184]|uniref:plasmid pRiA4b ORF-3 family protein n=1 Tax=Microbacterium sp. NPDC077184 TaxID=3154764 RepID=UPI00342D7E76
MRSTITLDTLHDVLQAAFGWADEHLHRFALGGGAWDRESQLFLCAYDVDNDDLVDGDDDEGIPDRDVRVDEVFADPGDVLRYVYDYGDAWQLILRLEAIIPAPDAATSQPPIAHCVDGRRAAPPENSRGLDAEMLATFQPDPAHFSASEVDGALGDVRFRMRDAGVPGEVIDLIERVRYDFDATPADQGTPVTDRLVEAAAHALATLEPAVADDDRDACLAAWTWFLQRAGGEGIPLTAAGYLKPADVVDALQILPTSDAWLSKSNREIDHSSLLHFRESLARQGFLRKLKGHLLLTRIGAAARKNPDRLWQALIDRWRGVVTGTHVVNARAGSTDAAYLRDATVCVLLSVAAGESFTATWGNQPQGGLGHAARWMSRLGWRRERQPLRGSDFYSLPIRTVLENLWDGPRERSDKGEMSATARRFAREVLRNPRMVE